MSTKKSLFDKRKLRNRSSIKKNIGDKLRLSVFRSNKHIYCQIIDDIKQITLCSSSTLDPEVKKNIKSSGTIDAAEEVGKDIATKAKKMVWKLLYLIEVDIFTMEELSRWLRVQDLMD